MTATIRARLIGLTATLAILAVLAGLPAMLLAIGANPLPDHVPTLEQVWTALTSRDDGTLTLRVLAVVAWAGWAFLTASGLTGTVTITGGTTVTVDVRDTYDTTFLGIIGITSMTVTGHGQARITRSVGGVEQ
jgi:hypothetical protein